MENSWQQAFGTRSYRTMAISICNISTIHTHDRNARHCRRLIRKHRRPSIAFCLGDGIHSIAGRESLRKVKTRAEGNRLLRRTTRWVMRGRPCEKARLLKPTSSQFKCSIDRTDSPARSPGPTQQPETQSSSVWPPGLVAFCQRRCIILDTART
jgi:hypothetical protein